MQEQYGAWTVLSPYLQDKFSKNRHGGQTSPLHMLTDWHNSLQIHRRGLVSVMVLNSVTINLSTPHGL